MLTAIYYSETRDNIVLLQATKKDGKFMVSSGLHSDRIQECSEKTLAEALLDKEYQLIGFYNE